MSARGHREKKLWLERLEHRLAPSLTPIGPEFRVNVYTLDHQRFADVGADAQGHYVVAYHGIDEAFTETGFGAIVQRYDSLGNALGDPIPVGQNYGISSIINVAVNDSGQFVVAWDYFGSVQNPSGLARVFARRYDANGQPLGPSFQVPQATGAEFTDPNVAIDEAGNFAITWSRREPGTTSHAIQARWFAADGTALTGDVPIGTTTANGRNSIDVSSNGIYAITWRGPQSAYLRSYHSNGQPVANTLEISGGSSSSNVTFNSNDEILMTYAYGPITVQRFSIFGEALDEPAFVGNGGETSLAVGHNGDFVVSWSYQQNIYVRQFNADCEPLTDAVRANTYVSLANPYNLGRYLSNVALSPFGDAFVVWQSFSQDGDGWGVYAQRFAGPAPHVTQATFNNGSQQRSSVTEAKVGFNRTVTLPPNPSTAFEVTGSVGAVPFQVDLSGSTPSGTVAKLIFPGGLANGRYNLKVKASMLHDTAGQAMGADYIVPFHRLLGDFNGDARVDGTDFAAFRAAFGTQSPLFDLDGDGQVGAGDFARFREVFGLMI